MMEVRCCCDAGKLLGWLPDPAKKNPAMDFKAGEEVVRFEVSLVWINPGTERPYLAYKSRDYPMELLRKIPEFMEVK